MEHLTTPFGRRPLTAAQINAQTNAAACPDGTTVDKWAVVRNIAYARTELGLGDRAIAVLTALVSFHPETKLETGEGARLVVYPSNVQIRQRANGIAEATLRHHLGALVEAGILIRRDSPNGKRYLRKGHSGSVPEAFGFDLTPLVARRTEFEERAERIAAADRAERLAKERVSIMRRDLRKLIEWASESGAAGPWDELSKQLAVLMAGYPRRPTTEVIATTSTALCLLLTEAHKHLDSVHESKNLDGNAAENERHHQSSKTESTRIRTATKLVDEGSLETAWSQPSGSAYPLQMVLQACPDIIDYARRGIGSWSDLIDAAELVRGMLGVSPSAWSEAREVMGAETAAATVAAILQRAESIRSPGGYLRNLVGRKRAGQFSLGPVLQALIRSRAAPGRAAAPRIISGDGRSESGMPPLREVACQTSNTVPANSVTHPPPQRP